MMYGLQTGSTAEKGINENYLKPYRGSTADGGECKNSTQKTCLLLALSCADKRSQVLLEYSYLLIFFHKLIVNKTRGILENAEKGLHVPPVHYGVMSFNRAHFFQKLLLRKTHIS